MSSDSEQVTQRMPYYIKQYPQKIGVYLEPQNMTLFVNRVFAVVISEVRMNSHCLRMGPKSNDWCLCKERWRHTETPAGRKTKWQGRLNLGWYSGQTGRPKTAESHQKLGRGKRGLSARAFRGGIPLLTSWFQTSSPQSCEKISFYV